MVNKRLFKAGTQCKSYRWRFLAVLAAMYPDRMKALTESQPAYQSCVNELGGGNHLLMFRVIEQRLAARVPWVTNLETPAEDALFDALHQWASGLSLVHLILSDPFASGAKQSWPNRWALAYGVRLLSKLSESPRSDLTCLCESEANPILISAVTYKKANGPMPEPPHYFPGIQIEDDYFAEVEKYTLAKRLWAEANGDEIELDRRELVKHFRWLAWRIVERLSWRGIESRDALNFGSKQGYTAVKDAVDKLSLLIRCPSEGCSV